MESELSRNFLMDNISSFVLRMSRIIEQGLSTTFRICYKISCMYKEERTSMPYSIDLLNEALRSENLKETAHCRILYKLLQNRVVQNSFVQYFFSEIDYSYDSIQIPYPDKHRIDLTIKGDSFFLIIENKINGACEQRNQINRYVQIAQQTYPNEQIYVLYLGGDINITPSNYSMSPSIQQLLQNRIICKNYKEDVSSWITLIYKQIDFNDEPFLKSALLLYKTYLENKYNLYNKYKEMNNKLDKELIETLNLNAISLDDKIDVIEDQLDNIDKIRERLSFMLQEYKDKRVTQFIKKWYEKCSSVLQSRPVLTMEDSMEFGFDFKYRNTDFRCCVSFDDNEDPYWGIVCLTEDINTRPKVFKSLQQMILQSNKGFHNNEDNSKEWVVSDYEKKEFIVEKFITLTQLICESELCTVIGLDRE